MCVLPRRAAQSQRTTAGPARCGARHGAHADRGLLRRTVRIDFVGRDCARGRVERVDGQVEADATNAFELEEATPIYFSAQP